MGALSAAILMLFPPWGAAFSVHFLPAVAGPRGRGDGGCHGAPRHLLELMALPHLSYCNKLAEMSFRMKAFAHLPAGIGFALHINLHRGVYTETTQGLVPPFSASSAHPNPPAAFPSSILQTTTKIALYRILLEVRAEMPAGCAGRMDVCRDAPSPLCREIY